MKKINKFFFVAFLGCLILAAAELAVAQTWHPANARVIAWDAVSAPVDEAGKAYPGTMKYQMYIRKEATGSPSEKSGGEIAETESTIVIPSVGKWFVGVDAVFYYTAWPDNPVRSVIAWSDDPASCADGKTFGVIYLPAPAMPKGLK
jgi:hypothetical protein